MFQTFMPLISVKFHHAAQPPTLISSDVPRFGFSFRSHALQLWRMRRTRPLEGSSLQSQVKQVPGHYQYRALGAVGIADTSILAPSLQEKLRKLGFYDSFMICWNGMGGPPGPPRRRCKTVHLLDHPWFDCEPFCVI